jgi:acetyltransferase-like isoleucine patch superfamily enzyme
VKRERLITKLLKWYPGAMGLVLRKAFYPRLFAKCGRNVLFGRFIDFHDPRKISIGDNVVISDRTLVDARTYHSPGSAISLENQVFIGTGTILKSHHYPISIGTGTNISNSCRVFSNVPIKIGQDTLLAAYCRIGSEDERNCVKDVFTPVLNPDFENKEIYVGSGCWLGVRVQVNACVTIGDGTIVGAHAIVESNLPDHVIAIGQPARTLRNRNEPTKKAQ